LTENPAEVNRLASDLIELSTRENFAFGWLWGPFTAVGAQRFPVTLLKVFR